MTTFNIDQGDDETFHVVIKSPLQADAPDPDAWDEANTSTWGPLDLTGSKLWFWIKTNAGVTVIEKTTDSGEGISVTDAIGGLADVEIGHAQTAALGDALIGKSLRLEVQVRSATGRITTLKRATITILRDRLIAT